MLSILAFLGFDSRELLGKTCVELTLFRCFVTQGVSVHSLRLIQSVAMAESEGFGVFALSVRQTTGTGKDKTIRHD